MGKWRFSDNSSAVNAAIERAIAAGLEEAGGEFEAQAKRNSRVDTGDTKSSFSHRVDGHAVYVGSNAENAIWEEFGTGVHAEDGSGRKKPWRYVDAHGKWHTTSGKRGTRALMKAMTSRADVAMKIVGSKLKEV